MQKLLYYLREYLFPTGCLCCGEALFTFEETFYGLCSECKNSFDSVFNDEKRCLVCGKPLISEKNTCLSCRENDGTPRKMYSENIEKMWVFFIYRGKFKAVLGAYKFRKYIAIVNYFAHCLNIFIDKSIDLPFASLVPVPPRPGKIKKQGWDQIDFLAKKLISVNRCLKRLPSRSQKELNRAERALNLKGRIICHKKAPKIAILLDDVITTGATLEACAEALLKGGTEKVYCICLFYN